VKNSPEFLLLKFLPSTYTITAISWSPSLILQLFFTLAILNGSTPFFTARLFLVDITSFCDILQGLDDSS